MVTVPPPPKEIESADTAPKSRAEIFEALCNTVGRSKFLGRLRGMLGLKVGSKDSTKDLVEKLAPNEKIRIRKVAELLDLKELRDACRTLCAPLAKKRREDFLDHLDFLSGIEPPAPAKPPRAVRSKMTSAPGRTKKSEPASSPSAATKAATPQNTPADQRALVRESNTAILKKILRARDQNGAYMADLKAELPLLSQKIITTMLHKFLEDGSVRTEGRTLGQRWIWVPRKTIHPPSIPSKPANLRRLQIS